MCSYWPITLASTGYRRLSSRSTQIASREPIVELRPLKKRGQSGRRLRQINFWEFLAV